MKKLLLSFALLPLFLFVASSANAEICPMLNQNPCWVKNSDMITPRTELSAASDSLGNIYTLGGDDGFHSTSRVLEKFDPLTNSWESLAPVPTPMSGMGFAYSIKTGKFYSVGGFDGSIGPLNYVYEYDPLTNIWTQKNSISVSKFAFQLIADSNGDLYAIGGLSSDACLDTVEKYDPTSDSWTTKASMPTARCWVGTAVAPNGKIYAIGGHTTSGVQLATVEEYDPTSDIWTAKAQMPTPRSILGVTINAQGTIYAIGGTNNGTYYDTVEEYNPSANTWSTKTPLPIPDARFGVALGVDQKVYVIGGENAGNLLLNITYAGFAPTPASVLSPTADSYIKQGSANENEGASTFLRLQSSGHNRALLKFDESQIQAAVGSASSFSAKLQLTITDNGNNWGTNGRSIEVHRLTRDWIEGNGFIDGNNPSNRGTGSGATWNCATDSDIHNQASNCSGSTSWNMTTSSLWPFASAATASTTITNNQSGVIELDVTSDVQSFLNDSNQNYGWLIKKTDEGQNGKVEFGSRESANGAKLIITPN